MASAFDCFWGENNQGYDAIFGRLKQGKHVCEEVLTLVKERASLEEEYAKRLSKMAKAFTVKEEIGTMKVALDTLRKEMENSAQTHADMAVELRLQIEKPLAEFIANQSAIRKRHQSVIDKHIKLRASQTVTTIKAKERYESRNLEVEILSRQLRGSLPTKEAEKLKQRLDKVALAANQADVDYRTGSERLVDTSKRWETDWMTTCEDARKMEEDRLEILRDNIWNFTNMVSSVCVSDDEGCERVRKSLEEFDVDVDIDEFVRTRSTGKEIPEPIPYVKYQPRDGTFHPDISAYGSPPSRSSLEKQASKDALSLRTDTKLSLVASETPQNEPKKSMMSTIAATFKSSKSKSNTASPENDQKNKSASPQAQKNKYAHNSYDDEDDDDDDDFNEYDPYDLPAGVPFMCKVVVLFDYKAQADEELTITKGQIIPVWHKNEDGWWEGLANENGRDRKGLFPSNFVSIIN